MSAIHRPGISRGNEKDKQKSVPSFPLMTAHELGGLQCEVAMTTAVIRGNEGTDFCLVIVAQCLCAGLLVIRPGFDSGWKFVFLIPS